jgi:hypothetical protein
MTGREAEEELELELEPPLGSVHPLFRLLLLLFPLPFVWLLLEEESELNEAI